MSKTVTWIVVAILVVVGIWYFMSRSSAPAAAPDTSAPTSSATSDATAVAPGANDTSDVQLQADLNASDAQIQSAGSAGASASSFSDTPVPQNP